MSINSVLDGLRDRRLAVMRKVMKVMKVMRKVVQWRKMLIKVALLYVW